MHSHMFTSLLFVVLERHMMSNYTFLDKKLRELGLDYQVLYLPDVPTALSLKQRLKKGKYYFNILKEFMREKYPNGICNTLIIYSNSEGFFFSNKKLWMPTLYKCKEVELQHGLMPIVFRHSKLRKVVSLLSEYLFGMSIIGKGFGGNPSDAIIVWGDKFKDFLVKKRRWDPDNVLVSGRMLKPLITKSGRKKEVKSVLFLLQDITKVANISYQIQIEYYKYITQLLSLYYEKVIIRKHPKMADSIYDIFKSYHNVSFSNCSLNDDLDKVDRAFSFISSALVDAFLMGKEVVAILLPEIPESNYAIFKRIIDVNSLESYLCAYCKSDVDAQIIESYFDTQDNVDEIILKILKDDSTTKAI